MQRASYLLMDEATKCRHPVHERLPWHVLFGISIELDPQTVTHQDDHALEQLVPSNLGLKEGLK
jgi:hypothetical protein